MILYGPNEEQIVVTQYKLGIGFHEQWIPIEEENTVAEVEAEMPTETDAVATTFLDVYESGTSRQTEFIDLNPRRPSARHRKAHTMAEQQCGPTAQHPVSSGYRQEQNTAQFIGPHQPTQNCTLPAVGLVQRIKRILQQSSSRQAAGSNKHAFHHWLILKVTPSGFAQHTGLTVFANSYGAAISMAKRKAALIGWDPNDVDVEQRS